jgi:outer membrane protein insertion porin family
MEVNAGKYSSVYSLAHTDPATTIDGIARTVSLAYVKTTQFVSQASQFSTTRLTAAMEYGIPISEYQGLRVGLSASSNELLASDSTSAEQAVDWVRANGSNFLRTGTTMDYSGTISTINFYGSRFNVFETTLGWSYDSRNRSIFADRGTRVSIGGSYALPGTSVR